MQLARLTVKKKLKEIEWVPWRLVALAVVSFSLAWMVSHFVRHPGSLSPRFLQVESYVVSPTGQPVLLEGYQPAVESGGEANAATDKLKLTDADIYWIVARSYLRTIAWAEGTLENGLNVSPYKIAFGDKVFDSYEQHPKISTRISSDPRRRSSDAAGAFQIKSDTWKGCLDNYDFWYSDVPEFAPANQELCALYLSYETGGEAALHSGTTVDANQRLSVSYDGFAKAIYADSRIWAAFPGHNIGEDSGQNTKPLWKLWSRFNWELWGQTGTRGPLLHPVGLQYPLTSDMKWRWHPVTGEWRFHEGIDVGTPMRTPIKAPEDGTFAFVDYEAGGAGHYFSFTPDSNPKMGFVTFHCTGVFPFKVGEHVKQGEVIAYSGTAGTGPHAHFEVLIDGHNVHPDIYLNQAAWFGEPNLASRREAPRSNL